jgi:Ca2+-binding RTX toxin-like protein
MKPGYLNLVINYFKPNSKISLFNKFNNENLIILIFFSVFMIFNVAMNNDLVNAYGRSSFCDGSILVDSYYSNGKIIVGTSNLEIPDCIIGTNKNNVILGLDGPDILHGKKGNDTLKGGFGNDKIFGGSGDDKIIGSEGDDQLYGNKGNDFIYGGFDSDFLSGGEGKDKLYGEYGEDVIEGGKGADLFDCGENYDVILDFNPSEGDSQNNCEQLNKKE